MTSTRTLSPNRIIALVCIAIFIGAMDLTVASAFLPQVVVDFELSTQQFALAGWVVTMYLAAYAVSMTFAGRLSDLYGRRPAYLVCLVIFIAGSILVALTRTPGLMPSFSLEWLVISRVIQALGAGAMVPISMALVGDLFPPDRRATPLGIIAAVDTAGWVVGHLEFLRHRLAEPVRCCVALRGLRLVRGITWPQGSPRARMAPLTPPQVSPVPPMPGKAVSGARSRVRHTAA